MKSKTNKLLDELIKLHPKYIDLSLIRLEILLKMGNPHLDIPKQYILLGQMVRVQFKVLLEIYLH